MSQRLIFEVTQNGQSSLWASGGASGGTVLLLQTTRNAINPLGSFGNFAVFYGDNAEPWVTDGTAAGTRQLADVNPGLFASFPQVLGVADGQLYFIARVGPSGAARDEIWSTDGVTASFTGDLATATRNPAGNQSVLLGATLVYLAFNDGTGWELCAYDTNGGDSFLLRDLRLDNPSDGSYPRGFTLLGDKAVFGASDDATGTTDLWVTDGTAAGTIKLREGFTPTYLASLGDRAVYIDRDPANAAANALFVTDGTVAGTRVLQGGLGTGAASEVEVVGDLVFYSIDDSAPSGDLWVTDGIDRMEKIADFSGTAGAVRPTQLTAFGDRVFFFANPDGLGFRLYASDGTAAGTEVVVATGGPAGPMAVVGGNLLFFQIVAGRTELWQTDGTAGGTQRLNTPIPTDFPYSPQLYGVIGESAIKGTQQDDNLVGSDGDDTIEALGGNDTIDGKGGADRMIGGEGNDTYIVDAADDETVETIADPVTGGIDTVRAAIDWTLADNVEVLILSGAGLSGIGNELDNVMIGSVGAQRLTAAEGNDTLDGGAGNDRLIGGKGDDTYLVDSAGDIVVEAFSGLATGGRDHVMAESSFTLGKNVEDLTILAGGENGVGNALDNVLTGSDGAQRLDGLDGRDSLSGKGGEDILNGGADDDTLVGGAGADTLVGGDNTDTADYGAEAEETGPGYTGIKVDLRRDQVIDTTGARDILNGIERIIGTGKDDTFRTRTTSDAEPGTGWTELFGGKGADEFLVSVEFTDVDGGDGTDLLDLSSFSLDGDKQFGLVIRLDKGRATRNDDFFNYEGKEGDTDLVLLTGIERVVGTSGADVIIGTSGDDTLISNGGNDILDGGAGNDTLVGGGTAEDALPRFIDSAGEDNYSGIADLSFRNSQSRVVIDHAAGLARGDDVDSFDLTYVELQGSRFNDTFKIAGHLVQSRGPGERYDGNLFGSDGRDLLDLSGTQLEVANSEGLATQIDLNRDVLFAFPGETALRIRGFEDAVGTLLANRIIGTELANRLDGHDGDDILEGRDGSDTLLGGRGSDRLAGGTGDDTLDGGTGFDWADYAEAARAISADLLAGTATGEGSDRLAGIEGLIGSVRSDMLAGDGKANRIAGGAGDDTLIGGEGDDVLSGGEDGAAGNAQSGNDTVSYARAAEGVKADLGKGTATGEGSDRLFAIDNLIGSRFDDVLTGDSGPNTLNGGDGNDLLAGGAGNDSLVGGKGSDTADFRKAQAAVTVDLAAGTASGEATDSLSGIENVLGSAFGDVIAGSSSRNALDGGDGRDTLNGGTGADRLTGGRGRDTFIYDKRDAADVIVDFKPGEDRLQIDNAVFANLTALLLEGQLRAAQFVSGPAPVATAAAQFLYETVTGILRFDGDGTGGLAPVLVLKLDNRAALSAADLEII